MVAVYENPKNPQGLAVWFPYSEANVKAIRQVLGLNWDPDKKVRMWVSQGPEILLDMERFGIKVGSMSPKAKFISEGFRQQLWDTLDCRSLPIDEPYAYQQQGSKFLELMPNSILADSMGLGKTKEALDAAVELKAERILVICPKTLTYNWLAEVDKWHPCLTAGVVPDTRKTTKKGTVLGREDFWQNLPQVVITNYEKLNLSDWPTSLEWDVVILDEATKFKTSSTQVYKNVKRVIKHSKVAWALTGTPLEIRLQELYNILSLLRPAVLGNFMRFKDQHLVTDWSGNIVGSKNLPVLRERIAPFMLRRTKEEVLTQLPPKIYNNSFVKLSPAEETAYQAFTSEFNNWLAEHDVTGVGDPLVQMLRMRQFCCTPKIFTDDLGWGSKFEAIKELVEEWPGQVVIFCFFKEVVNLLQDYLGCHSEAVISGDISGAEERLRRISAFNEGKLGKVLVSTDAGGMGLNITSADLIIHCDQLWNPQRMKQREDRLHRIGQTRPVTVTSILCLDTIDWGMYLVNKEREQLFEDVVEGAEESILRKLDAPRLKRIVEGKS